MKITFFLFLLAFFSISLFAFSMIKFNASYEKTEVNISNSSMERLNSLFKETDKSLEFFGYLDNKGDFFMVGYIPLDEKEEVIFSKDYNLKITETSIHSHPKNNLCYPSVKDMNSQEEIICLMCNIDKIRCFKNE